MQLVPKKMRRFWWKIRYVFWHVFLHRHYLMWGFKWHPIIGLKQGLDWMKGIEEGDYDKPPKEFLRQQFSRLSAFFGMIDARGSW